MVPAAIFIIKFFIIFVASFVFISVFSGSLTLGLLLIFNWRIRALQCYGFCHIIWSSHSYTYVTSFLRPPPTTTTPSYPSRLSQSPGWGLHHTANCCWLSILHMVMYIFQCHSLHSSHPLLPLCWDFRKWQPIPVFLPGKLYGRRSLVGYSPWGRKESGTTEQLHYIAKQSFS